MGKTVNKKFFGDPSDAGNQLEVEAWIPGAGAAASPFAWIVKQNTNTTYTITDGVDTGRCKLQATAATGPGQMRVAVSPFTGGTEYARILNAHQVKTFEGNVFAWSELSNADSFDEADLDFS